MCQLHNNIPAKVIKDNRDISDFVTPRFNSGITTSWFHTAFEKAEVKLVSRNNSRTNKINYTSVSLLSVTSKVHERLIY